MQNPPIFNNFKKILRMVLRMDHATRTTSTAIWIFRNPQAFVVESLLAQSFGTMKSFSFTHRAYPAAQTPWHKILQKCWRSILPLKVKNSKLWLPLGLGIIVTVCTTYCSLMPVINIKNQRKVKLHSHMFSHFQGEPFRLKNPGVQNVSLVVAHCKAALHWLQQYTIDYKDIDRVTIISKCGQDVVGAPQHAEIINLSENVGRCDHSYAFWINLLMQNVQNLDPDHVVLFLKDNEDNSHFPHIRRSVSDLVKGASQSGFSCQAKLIGWETFDVSAYARTEDLLKSSFPFYERSMRNLDYGIASSSEVFKSRYEDLGSWLHFLGIVDAPEAVQICYGGNFAARASNLKNHSKTFWKSLEESLSRGDSIEESHFAERSWGLFIADPLEKTEMEVLLKSSNMIILKRDFSLYGLLARNYEANETKIVRKWFD